jgi:hypothetical protein
MPDPSVTSMSYVFRRLTALALCLLLTVSPACAYAAGNNYFPLADGAKWEYTGRFSSADGKEFGLRATIRVDGETLIGGRRYFRLVTSSDPNIPGPPEANKHLEGVRYYRIAADGIYFRPGDNDPNKPDVLELPLPIPVGVRWLSGVNEAQAERAGTIRVGGREYRDCLKVTFRLGDGARSTENYYAPGVGVVKTVYVNTTEPKSVVELTLEKYEP